MSPSKSSAVSSRLQPLKIVRVNQKKVSFEKYDAVSYADMSEGEGEGEGEGLCNDGIDLKTKALFDAAPWIRRLNDDTMAEMIKYVRNTSSDDDMDKVCLMEYRVEMSSMTFSKSKCIGNKCNKERMNQ